MEMEDQEVAEGINYHGGVHCVIGIGPIHRSSVNSTCIICFFTICCITIMYIIMFIIRDMYIPSIFSYQSKPRTGPPKSGSRSIKSGPITPDMIDNACEGTFSQEHGYIISYFISCV